MIAVWDNVCSYNHVSSDYNDMYYLYLCVVHRSQWINYWNNENSSFKKPWFLVTRKLICKGVTKELHWCKTKTLGLFCLRKCVFLRSISSFPGFWCSLEEEHRNQLKRLKRIIGKIEVHKGKILYQLNSTKADISRILVMHLARSACTAKFRSDNLLGCSRFIFRSLLGMRFFSLNRKPHYRGWAC